MQALRARHRNRYHRCMEPFHVYASSDEKSGPGFCIISASFVLSHCFNVFLLGVVIALVQNRLGISKQHWYLSQTDHEAPL